MPRNLVLCCDGTNNQFGPENTNVVRLREALIEGPTQLCYYDPGIGTLPEPGLLTRIGKRISELVDLAAATGFSTKVEQAYTYLMNTWEPGDQVFLFGFSRGAYTVRVLAGLLHLLGLLPSHGENLVPYVMRLFSGSRKNKQEYWSLCDAFRSTFARDIPGSPDRRFLIHFIGVWDTVSSVGWIWDPAVFPFTRANPSINVVRHAVSVDERRAFFRQNLFAPVRGQDLKERWFAGAHCDVGGGYPESDGGLWRAPLEWVVAEATTAGLCVDAGRYQRVLQQVPPSPTPWDDKQHESLTIAWWIAEFFPKLHWNTTLKRRIPRLNLGRHREIPSGALIADVALRRLRDLPGYRPPNFTQRFIDDVIRLGAVPPEQPYQP